MTVVERDPHQEKIEASAKAIHVSRWGEHHHVKGRSIKGDVVRLAIFVAVGALLLTYVGATIQKVSFDDRYTLTATFDDVTGLFKGDPVKLAGVEVGQVSGIKLDHGRAVVKFAVDKTVRLPAEDTTVIVRWRNLIGQRDLYLDPGPNASTATEFIPMDGEQTIDKTKEATDIGALMNSLGPLATAVDPAQLNEIFVALADLLEGNGGNINSLLSNLGIIADVVASRDQTIAQMLTDLDTVTTVLARRDGQIQTMIDNVVLLSQSFTDNTELFLDSVDNLSSVTSSIGELFAVNEADFQSIIDSLAGVSNALGSKVDELEQAFALLPKGFEALFSTVNEGAFLKALVTCFAFNPYQCNDPSQNVVP